MKLLQVAALAALVFGAASCDSEEEDNRFPGYEKHESGVYFKKHKSGKGTIAVEDSALMVMEIAYVTENDSLFQPYMGQPQMMVVKKGRYVGDFVDVARTMKIGDSTTFMVRCDSLLKYTKGMRLPDFIDSSGFIGYVVKLDTIISAADFKRDMKKRRDEQMMQQQLAMNDSANKVNFLKENKITQKPLKGGVIYVEKTAGTGDKIKIGQTVTLHYKGYFMNGVVFDQSNKTPNSPPATMQITPEGLIQGFVDGLTQMKKGGKATIIVPPDLGYRDGLTRAFDLEVIEIK